MAAGAQAAAQRLGAGAGGHEQVGPRLVGVGEPDDVGQQVVPGQLLQRGEPGRPRCGTTSPRRTRLVGLGRTRSVSSVMTPSVPSEPSARPEQVGAGGGGRRVAQLQHAGRRGQGQPGDQLVEPADAGGVLPGRAGGRVAAEGGELPALRQVPEGEALAGRAPPPAPGRACPGPTVTRDDGTSSDCTEAIRREVDGDRRPVVGVDAGQPADDAGAAAERDDDDAELAAGGEQRGGLLGGAGQRRRRPGRRRRRPRGGAAGPGSSCRRPGAAATPGRCGRSPRRAARRTGRGPRSGSRDGASRISSTATGGVGRGVQPSSRGEVAAGGLGQRAAQVAVVPRGVRGRSGPSPGS